MLKSEITQVQDMDYYLRASEDRVRFEFTEPTKWLGFTPEQARQLAKDLLELADEVEQRDYN